MVTTVLTDEFVEAMARLDGAAAKRTAAFLDKLVKEPEASSLNLEMVNDSGDRTIHSMRVNSDLRAIVGIDGQRMVLMYVAHHDAAYAWARTHCLRCHPHTGELEIVPIEASDIN